MIRRAEKKDAAAIKKICEESLGYPADEKQLEQRIGELAEDRHYYLAVYEENSEVQAFIEAERYDIVYGGRGWNVIALAVEKDYQGRGIGKEMMAALENLAAEEGCDFVRLNSRIERSEAHEFYEHLGYECTKTQKRFIRKIKTAAG